MKDEFIQNFDMIKSDGEFFGAFFTTAGMVDLLCGVEISDSGKELHLKDIAIYPQKK
ncbi:MAG: hypothetical protein HC887_10430 [Desulfobacteraceae bacterium]|nr:hypothetical protein [Desulfobacteraceae bacterium]